MNIKRMLVALSLVCSAVLVAYAQDAGRASGAKQAAAAREQARIAVQQICPVSGQKLGAHGAPIKVVVGKYKQEIYLCCKGCLKGKINPQHWATIHANFARAQGICPVMKQRLPQKPQWTIVKGQVIYVCCPPCTKKLAAKPDMYLQKLDELYRTALSRNRRLR